MRRLTAYTCTMTLLLAALGCSQDAQNQTRPDPSGREAEPPIGSDNDSPAPSTREAGSLQSLPAPGSEVADADSRQVMAIVNGEALFLKPLNDALLRRHGYKLAQQMIADELVRQEAEKLGLEVTAEEIEAERDAQLARMIPQIQDPAQRRAMQGQLMRNLGITRDVWDMVVRRNALLGKIAAQRLEITEEMLQAEFARQHEQKVRVRHMQLPSLPAAQNMLKRLENGADFAALVRENSMGPTASAGGLLEPFGAKDETVPKQLRQSAMRLKTPGEISEVIMIGKSFHLLRLEEILPPADVEFEDVKPQLRRDLRRRLTDARKPLILNDLFREALDEGRILIVNPILKQEHEEARRRSRASDEASNPRE